MANTKIEQLKSKASTIKNEVEEGRNTANRIGGAFSDVAEILDSQDQYLESQKTELESQKEDLNDSKKKISLVARGTIESSKIDTLNSMVSEGLYVLTGQATNMSHLLVTSASNGWIYQYLFGPFNASASGVPATDGGASQNTIGVRFYNKTSWSEWKYVDLSYLSGIKEVISGIQTAISSIELTTEKVMEGGKSQKSINEETAASLNDLASKVDDLPTKDNETDNTDFVDALRRVGFRVNNHGANAKSFNVCDENGNILFSLDKTFVENLISMAKKGEVLSESFVVDDDGNLYFCDGQKKYSVAIYKNGVFDCGSIGKKLMKIIEDMIKQYAPEPTPTPVTVSKTFVAIGDSITQGAGATGSNAWVTQFSNYLRSKNYISSYKNFGSGGNTSSGIASFCGAKQLYITNNVVIPATVTGVEITLDNSTMRLWDAAGNCRPCSSSDSWDLEPCYLAGVAGFITYDKTSSKYTFTRQTAGEQKTIFAYEPIISRAAHHCLDADYMTIFVGTNNQVGSDSAKIASLMEDVRKLTKLSKNGRYIVISSYVEANQSMPTQTMISEFRKEYGARHFDLYQYFSTRGVIDAVNEGLLPSGEQTNWVELLLVADKVHPNDVGHTLIFERIKERFEQLKYFN